MEELAIKNIPSTILSRVLVQLFTLPPTEQTQVMSVLTAGLQAYGNTSDINAFLDYCSTYTSNKNSRQWLWTNYEINSDLDWDLANSKKPIELVGLRFLLSSETARQKTELTRYGRDTLLDPKCVYFYQDRILPVDSILNDTLDYLKQERKKSEEIDKVVEHLIELRLEQYSRDKFKFQQESNKLDNTTYNLMGALMTRYDTLASRSLRSWCLYYKDYSKGEDKWRIILEREEIVVSSEQALADIRGIPDEISLLPPTEFSKDYRPVTLFYVNQAKLAPQIALVEEEFNKGEQHITLDDYTFDDDYDYLDIREEQQPQQGEFDDVICMYCQSKEDEEGNDMYMCDNCSRGVHQLCEVPTIQDFEKDLDPWFCRSCTEQMKTTSLLSLSHTSHEANDICDPSIEEVVTLLPEEKFIDTPPSSEQNVLPTKRKRDTDDEQENNQ